MSRVTTKVYTCDVCGSSETNPADGQARWVRYAHMDWCHECAKKIPLRKVTGRRPCPVCGTVAYTWDGVKFHVHNNPDGARCPDSTPPDADGDSA